MENIYTIHNGELRHYGVPGMRWGVRKDRKSGRIRGKIKKDPIKSMSDEELNKKINRLQKEGQYKQLTDKHAAGKKLVAGIIVGSVTAVAKGYLTKYMKTGIEAGVPALVPAATKAIGDWVIPDGTRIM